MRPRFSQFFAFVCSAFLISLSIAGAQTREIVLTEDEVAAKPVAGQVVAFNPNLRFIITNAVKGVKEGTRIAVRRNGLVIAVAVVEDVAPATTTAYLIKHPSNSALRRPQVRDEVIVYTR